jgi:hypothetical protein
VFDSVQARYVLRCVLFGVSAFLVSVQASATGSSLTWAEVLYAAIAGGLAALAYAGIGAASTAVEPSIGNKRAQ